MPGVQTVQSHGADLPKGLTAGGWGKGRAFQEQAFPCFSSLSPAFHQLTGLWKGPLWRKGDAFDRGRPILEEQGGEEKGGSLGSSQN